MAQRRMFSKTITNSSRFLMMPPTSQLLYIHLSMNADDDGFCEHFPIMRMVEAKPDDLKVLSAKDFVKVFDDKVLIITEWKENNYIQKDRYTASKYLGIYKKELKLLSKNQNGMYTERIHDVSNMDTQVRLGKDSIGKDKKEETEQAPLVSETIKLFEVVNSNCKTMYGNTTQRKAVSFLLEEYGFEMVKKVIALLPKTNTIAYMPTITTPVQLKDKWATLEAGLRKEKGKITNNSRLEI